MTLDDLKELAARVVQKAMDAGATGAECTVSDSTEFSAKVRMGELEQLQQAGSRAMGVRVVAGRRMGSSFTSDLTADGVDRMVRSAVEVATYTSEDPHAGMPDAGEMAASVRDLGLYSDSVANLPGDSKIEQARRAEAAALAFDPRISNSEGGSFDSNLGLRVFANSHGFCGGWRSSSCSVSAVPVAAWDGRMERDYWYSIARDANQLEDPESVGRRAAQRVLRRLGAVKVETQRVPVIFEQRVARSLLGHVFEAVDGRSVYRESSFLAGKLGEKVAHEGITIIDDGTIPGMFGSQPFDDEGVPTRRTAVIERGVLRSYLLNSYAARKLGMRTTGNASRGISGNAGIGIGNFYVESGSRSGDEMVRGISNGFFVTELIGNGVNTVTGDYSRGAAGIWIRDGELAFPVSEVTIAGTLQEMLAVAEIGNDPEVRGSMWSPTVMIGEMTVAGR